MPAGASAPSSATTFKVSPSTANAAAPQELVLAAYRDLAPGEKDPYYTGLTLHTWESLVGVDDDWNPRPELAESWQPSADGLSWTFHLRHDVVFCDGSPFNAAVVIANVNRNLKISPRSSTFYSFDKAAAYGDLRTVEQVDDYTVRFVHNTPAPTFPAMIATYYGAMFAPASFAANGDFVGPPITTGPFRVVERKADQYVLLEANLKYRGTPPRAQRVRILTIPDPNTRVSALRAGEIQGVLDLGAIQPAAALELAASGQFSISSVPIAITHYIRPNGSKAPWSDYRVRQAISLALDRQRIVNDLLLGYGVPAGSILSIVSKQWYDPSITLPYDPAQAATLAKAVLGDKRQPAVLLIQSLQLDRYPYKALAEYVQAQLKPLGIDVEVRILDSAAYNAATAAGDYDFNMGTQGLSNSEPESLFRSYLAKDGSANKANKYGYYNETVEATLNSLAKLQDPAQRKQAYNTIQQIAAREAPMIPLFYEKGIAVYRNDVVGYALTTNGGVTLDTAGFK